jgi:hypothetical protein
MAELDPSIIFRQEKYSGPTQDELDAKQDMNALRNMLGAGRAIDSPEVINAMMARSPDMGLKLQSNASTMQTNAAAAQKSIADARAKDREARIAELDALLPVGSAIVQRGDQQAWGEFRTFLGQKFPEALMGYPDNVAEGGKFLQDYITARQQMVSKGNTTPFRRGAPVPTDRGYITLNEAGLPEELRDPSGRTYMPVPRGDGDGSPPTYGMSSEYAIDADGNTVLVQRGSRGDVKITRLPEGLRPALPTRSVDLGTTVQTVESAGGTPRATTPKDVQGEALQAQVGKDRAAQLMAAPAAVASGTRFLAQLDALDADPNLERGTGISSYFNFVPGTGGKAFQVKLNKAVGSAFLDAIKALQGTGAITDREGGAATASVSGLDAGLDAASFRKELKILRDMVAKGLEAALVNVADRDRILGVTPSTGAATPAPAGAGAPGAPALFSPEELAKLRGGQ